MRITHELIERWQQEKDAARCLSNAIGALDPVEVEWCKQHGLGESAYDPAEIAYIHARALSEDLERELEGDS